MYFKIKNVCIFSYNELFRDICYESCVLVIHKHPLPFAAKNDERRMNTEERALTTWLNSTLTPAQESQSNAKVQRTMDCLRKAGEEEEIWFNGTSTQKGHIVPEVW
jgi:hypothetical protein